MRKMKSIMLLPAIFTNFFCQAQTEAGKENMPIVAFKTNLLYDISSTINLGTEIRLDNRSSLDIPFNWNPFSFSNNRKWKHFLVQPELRLCSKEKGDFAGHFFGMHAHYAFYNVGNLPKPPMLSLAMYSCMLENTTLQNIPTGANSKSKLVMSLRILDVRRCHCRNDESKFHPTRS